GARAENSELFESLEHVLRVYKRPQIAVIRSFISDKMSERRLELSAGNAFVKLALIHHIDADLCRIDHAVGSSVICLINHSVVDLVLGFHSTYERSRRKHSVEKALGNRLTRLVMACEKVQHRRFPNPVLHHLTRRLYEVSFNRSASESPIVRFSQEV